MATKTKTKTEAPDAIAKAAGEALSRLVLEGDAIGDEVDRRIRARLASPLSIEIKRQDRETVQISGPFHRDFRTVLAALQAGPTAMIGPAGCGKSTIATQCAKALDLSFFFNGAIQHEYKLTGFVDANGKTVRTPFREAYEHGGVYLFDEIDASSANALLAFNAALSGNHMDFPDGVAEKHKDFLCLAAANTFGTGRDRVYVGRNQLDAATMDRFAFVSIDYDERLELTVACNLEWVAEVVMVREVIREKKIRHVVSPRASILGARLIEGGMDREKVRELALWKGLDGDSVEKVRAEMKARRSTFLERKEALGKAAA